MLQKGKVAIGAWYGVDDTKYDIRHMQEAADCGIDFLFTGYGHDERSRQIVGNAEKIGMELILFDWEYYQKPQPLTTQTVEKSLDHISSPAVIGHALFDEPNSNLYDLLEENRQVYKQRYPDKLGYMNLLPLVRDKNLIGVDTYEEYIELFAQKINTDYISVDIYPLATEDGKNSLQPDYINNLSIVSSACLRYDREFWCFVQSMPFNIIRRAPSLADMRFEFYSLLAFGAVKLVHFCYATPPSGDEKFPYAMTDIYGEKTPLWYFCREVNSELHAFSSVYEQYKYLGTCSYKTDDVPEYLSFKENAPSANIPVGIESDECLLIGCFERDGGKGWIITNMSRLEDEADTEVSFICGKPVTVYIKGVGHRVAPDKDGKIRFCLESGEGVFVTEAEK